MNIESTGIAQEETVFFDPTDQLETTEKELWKRKTEAGNAISSDPPVITVSCYYANDLHKDTTIVNIAQLTKPSRILIEQYSDPTLLNFKREMLGLPFDEQILLNDARYMHYSRNKRRIIIKDDILYRQYYNDTGEVSHLQVLLPGQLLKVLLQSLHGTAGKHPGISKMMQEIRQKYYFPSIATYVRNWVRDCEICIHDKRINNTRITPELTHIPEWDLGPEDLMQIDLLPELPPSGVYENIITAIDLFSRYAFAYPVSNPTAVNTAKVIIDIMTRHAYLPTLIITDKGSVFVSQVIHEVAEILGTNLKHATTKHAQTIGVLERAHATIKTSLKMASGEYRKQWHKYLPIAILNYNTTYHSSIDCEPSRVVHGRVPHNILDHKLGLRFNPNITPTTDFAEELLRRTKILYEKTKKNVMQSYIKYKKYYDKKAKASPLKEKDYCFILQPKADHQGSKIPFRDFRWIGPYIVEKVLPNNNYIVRKLDTKPKCYTESVFENTTPKNLLKTTIREFNGRLTIISLSHKMTYTQLHGKRNLVDTSLIFLSYTLTLTQLILMIVTHRNQILLLYHVPILMIPTMVKTRKHAPFLTHLYHKIQRLNRMVKVRTLRPLLT